MKRYIDVFKCANDVWLMKWGFTYRDSELGIDVYIYEKIAIIDQQSAETLQKTYSPRYCWNGPLYTVWNIIIPIK